MISTNQAAVLLGVCRERVRQLFRAGHLDGEQLFEGSPIRIDPASVQRLKDGSPNTPGSPA